MKEEKTEEFMLVHSHERSMFSCLITLIGLIF